MMASEGERQKVYARVESRGEDFVRLLSDYARIATISAHGSMFQEGADATAALLSGIGARVRLLSAEGGPSNVVGEIEEDPDFPWVILYNHYDVQPVDPFEEWTSGPFEPVVREGKLYGRGVADTKGNAVAQALAVESIRDVLGRLPVNVRFFIDGEEESGSPHLASFADAHPDLFQGLGATIEAAGHTMQGRPIMTLGSKGVLGIELEVRTARVDQHSGGATILPNAAWRLLAALRSLRSDSGRVLIRGFEDGIPPPEEEMLRFLRKASFDPASLKEAYGVQKLQGGRTPYEVLKRYIYGTTCTINGIWSGYTGPGAKTVNPAVARAKLDLRLLPGQKPHEIYEKLLVHLREKGFDDVHVKKDAGVFEPASTRISERIVQAVLAATREVYGVDPDVYPWSAGSSTTWYYTRVGTPALHPPGVGYMGSLAHAPNEHIRLEDAMRSMKTIAGALLHLEPVP